MMADWDNDDVNLLAWRAETAETGFEKTPAGDVDIAEQEYFDNAVLMVAMVKAGVELAFESMVRAPPRAVAAALAVPSPPGHAGPHVHDRSPAARRDSV